MSDSYKRTIDPDVRNVLIFNIRSFQRVEVDFSRERGKKCVLTWIKSIFRVVREEASRGGGPPVALS